MLDRLANSFGLAAEAQKDEAPTLASTKDLGKLTFVDPALYRIEQDGWISASEQARAHRDAARKARRSERAAIDPVRSTKDSQENNIYAHYRFQRLAESVYPGLREDDDGLESADRPEGRPASAPVFPRTAEAQDSYLLSQGHGTMLQSAVSRRPTATTAVGPTSPEESLASAKHSGPHPQHGVQPTVPGEPNSKSKLGTIMQSPLRVSGAGTSASSAARNRHPGTGLSLPFVGLDGSQPQQARPSTAEADAEIAL